MSTQAVARNGRAILLCGALRSALLARHAQLLASGERPVLSLARFVQPLDGFEWPTFDEAAIDVTTDAQLERWLSGGARA